ncbi:unnamed protein product [Diamesa serratosioi]
MEIVFPIVLTYILVKVRSSMDYKDQEKYSEFHWESFEPQQFSDCFSSSYRSYDSFAMAPANNTALVNLFKRAFNLKYNIKLFQTSEQLEDYLYATTNVVGGIDFHVNHAYTESRSMVNSKYLIGATFKNNEITVWFNGEFYHTMPLALNTLYRAMLIEKMGNNYDIQLTNSPFILKKEENFLELGFRFEKLELVKDMISVFVLFVFIMIYWPAIFIGFYIRERSCKAKLLQMISGVNKVTYWITSWIIDYFIFYIILIAIIIFISCFQLPYINSMANILELFFIMNVYAFTVLPMIYLFSYLFTNITTGELMVPIFTIIWTVKTFDFNKNGIIINFLFMGCSALFNILICVAIDYRLFDNIIQFVLNKMRNLPPSKIIYDLDVKAEADKINSLTNENLLQGKLVLRKLSKFYGNTLAVNQLCLGVEGSECFGLLGINGAGKTSVFKMLTGDENISGGNAWVEGFSIKEQLNRVHQRIGYCPQFDALLDDLTGREILKIFSLLRGIPMKEMELIYTKLATELNLLKHLDKQAKSYSGGNKRKLSTALALIGDPALIFLDEPTSGMDPGAKRQLWNIINKTRNSGRSVVLTSHSMEECEALCTRIAIMVNGEFKCLGSTQHLKNKFSNGFILTVKTGDDQGSNQEHIESIKGNIRQKFPTSELKEQYLDILTYHIPTVDVKWSKVFGLMAQAKSELNIADYSLTQTSLEQVFLFFTKSGYN